MTHLLFHAKAFAVDLKNAEVFDTRLKAAAPRHPKTWPAIQILGLNRGQK